MPSAPRVLLCVAHGGTGGMQVQIGLLARALGEVGCEVAVACGPGPLEVDEASVLRLPPLSAGSAHRVVAALRGHVARVRPDVVHGHGLRLAGVLAAVSRRRAVVTCHGLDPRRARRTAAVARATGVAVASCGEGPRRVLSSVGLRSRVLDNAVPAMPTGLSRDEVARRSGAAASGLLVVSPARLTEQKDPLTLVRALGHASGATALLVGGGPLEDEVQRAIAREGLTGRVVLSPWREDARDLVASADVVALSSRWEGQPTAVLEAMAAGVCVVATACTGTADTVVDDETALLAAPGDALGLAAALERASDAALRARLAANGRAAVAQHAPAVVAAAHLDAYERLRTGRWLDPMVR